ncbi:MAG TPA: alpha/beta fold hydrolase [Polyangiales bacterium]|nr:alpha/beta fold hydrolase [Polyangiales bacterium]
MAGTSLITTFGKLAHDAGRRFRRHVHARPLLPAVEAERHVIATADAGAISYYEDASGEGRPLVLLHGIHAAASAFEMRTLFDAFRGERPVYALDLPGFGFSQRGGMRYSATTYVRAIEHLLRHIASEREDQRADLVALSLSSEYAAAVAAELPDLVHSLVLISPTGFGKSRREGTPQWLKAVARAGGELFYELLITRPSLRHYLHKSFVGPIDPSLLEYSHATSHQPGAQYAPLAFVSGELFPAGDPQQTYGRVKAPVLVLFDQDPYSDFGGLRGFVSRHDNYETLRVLRTRGLPQIEASERTIHGLRAYWDRIHADGAGGQRRAEQAAYAQV